MVGARGFEPRTSTVSGCPEESLTYSRFPAFHYPLVVYAKLERVRFSLFLGVESSCLLYKNYTTEKSIIYYTAINWMAGFAVYKG